MEKNYYKNIVFLICQNYITIGGNKTPYNNMWSNKEMGENNFYSLVAEGNRSEQLVADWLTNKGWTVVNVTADKKYQDLEIDLIATKGNEVRTIEVKRENRCADTANLLLEPITNTRTKNKGWFKKTKADFICWHDTQNNKLLFSLTSALQEIIKQP